MTSSDMRDSRHRFGQDSELMAEQFLRAKGYRIVARNLKTQLGELDIIAEDNGVLVFVEVKGRATEAFGGALLAVDRRKQAKLLKLAAQYLARHHLSDRFCRFDVVLVQGVPSEGGCIEHLQNAFDASQSESQA